MARLLRLTLATLLFAAPALLVLTPRCAEAVSCTAFGCSDEFVIEYVNENTGHYLLLPEHDPEVAFVEGGGAGPGWQLTGNGFEHLIYEGQPVCRFYSPVFDTHFYTVDAAECALVKQNPDWVYEKSPFKAFPAHAGSCDFPWVPVYRFYHAGDHRYTGDTGIRDAMLARGWTDEGIAFCVESAGRGPIQGVFVAPAALVDSAQACGSVGGPCIALDSLAPMTNVLTPYDPGYPPSGTRALVTGADVSNMLYSEILTSQPADPYTILQHSFAGIPGGDLYINGRDRTGGDYARITHMVALPGVTATGGQRLFVWRAPTDRELRVSAIVHVGVVELDGAGSQAYGGPLLQFGDVTSGHSFRVTIQAYGTVPPGDFVAPDARTGEPIVSTVFRANPMFGTVLSGSFIACRDRSVCAPARSASTPPVPYTFSLKRADFQAAVDRARTVDPALSANPADYFVAQVGFNNETYLDARLGATVSYMDIEVWYVE